MRQVLHVAALDAAMLEEGAVARAGRPLVLDDLVAAPVEDRMLSYYREGQDFLQAVRRDVTLLRA